MENRDANYMEEGRPTGILERVKADKDILTFAKRVKVAFFSGLTFFIVFVIFAGFGLLTAYIAHLIVSIGSEHPKEFTVPEWVEPVEGWSIGLFVLALLGLAAAEPWKDAYKYFRYGTVEPSETVEEDKSVEPEVVIQADKSDGIPPSSTKEAILIQRQTGGDTASGSDPDKTSSKPQRVQKKRARRRH